MFYLLIVHLLLLNSGICIDFLIYASALTFLRLLTIFCVCTNIFASACSFFASTPKYLRLLTIFCVCTNHICVSYPFFASAPTHLRLLPDFCVCTNLFASPARFLRLNQLICVSCLIFASKPPYLHHLPIFCVCRRHVFPPSTNIEQHRHFFIAKVKLFLVSYV